MLAIVRERSPRPTGWGTQPLRIQLRLLTFQFSCLPVQMLAPLEVLGYLLYAVCSINMPPLWG